MNILGVDFGTKNVGLAWVDVGIGVVLPYGIIKDEKNKTKPQQLADLVEVEKIDKIVIGLPVSLKGGQENKNTARIRAFAEEIKGLVDVPVEFMNEMFSSQQADRMGGGASRDEKSAMVILEDYLNTIHDTRNTIQ
mgnify:FL=1